jgi:hypothetical protein
MAIATGFILITSWDSKIRSNIELSSFLHNEYSLSGTDRFEIDTLALKRLLNS